jgi:hypothetical protein
VTRALVALALALAPALALAQDPAGAQLDRVLQLVQANAQLDALAPLFEAQAAAFRGQLPPEAAARLDAAAKRAAAPAIVRPPFKALYQRNLDAGALAGIEAFYDSPLGHRVADAEARASTPEGMAQLSSYLATLRSVPPGERRTELAQRFARASQSSEISMRVQLGAMRAVASAARLLGPPESRVSQEQLDAQIAAARAELEKKVPGQTVSTLLYVHQSLTTRELERYVEFVEAPAGAWLYGQFVPALDAALDAASRELGAGVRAPSAPRGSELDLEQQPPAQPAAEPGERVDEPHR